MLPSTSVTRMITAPIPSSRPDPQRASEYGSSSRAAVVYRPTGPPGRAGCYVEQDHSTEGHCDCPEWMRASPEQRADGNHRGDEGEGSPEHVLPEDTFEDRRRQQQADEQPVPPHPPGRMRRSWFGPQQADDVSQHDLSVEIPAAARIGPKYGSLLGRSAEGTTAFLPRCPPSDPATLRRRPFLR